MAWETKGEYLVKEFNFKNFNEALSFVNKVGDIAERLDHHPNIFLHSYKFVVISTTTHSEGKVTQKDEALANKIDAILN
jgi:4a-hydroxytetrahydrobiopterin dehydratase